MAERKDVIRTRALIEKAYYELLFKKNDNKRNFKNNNRKNYDNRDNKPKDENEYDDIVEGRNAVLELLNSDRDINKIFVQSGERHGSINKIK